MISFAWKELGGADYAAVQAEASKEITGRIREWIEGHGDFPSIEECSKDLGVCKAVVSKHTGWRRVETKEAPATSAPNIGSLR